MKRGTIPALITLGLMLLGVVTLTFINMYIKNQAKEQRAQQAQEARKIAADMELTFIQHAFDMKCDVSGEGVDRQISNITFNETELQIRVHSFNYFCRELREDPNHVDITAEELKGHLKNELDGGERTEELKSYLDWWGYAEERNLYRSKLKKLHEELKKIQPEAIGKQIEELTPNQINILAEELNKKLQAEKEGKTYQLNPELDLEVSS